jgi:hypothetical protein
MPLLKKAGKASPRAMINLPEGYDKWSKRTREELQ